MISIAIIFKAFLHKAGNHFTYLFHMSRVEVLEPIDRPFPVLLADSFEHVGDLFPPDLLPESFSLILILLHDGL